MKVKRFAVERIPMEVEYIRPVAGRLYLLFHFHRLIKYVKFKPVFLNGPVCKPIYRLDVPKIEVKKNEES